MSRTVTVRVDAELERALERECRLSGRSRSDVVRDAVRRRLSLVELGRIRRHVAPLARTRGYRIDEDVFADIS